jgi:CPA1 family monovalent cation:H+ antiporter
VSLAAALALPLETADGTPLPYRETLIAVTFAVILFTLVVQGLSMPAVVRWARLPPDPTEEWENLLAERTALQAALDAVGQKAEESRATAAVRDSLLEEYRARLDVLAKQMNDDDKTVRSIDEVGPDGDGRGAGGDGDGGESALRLALLPVKRRAIAQLRRSRQIDDVVLRRIQARLDAEEIRLAAHAGALDDEP